MRWLSAMLLTFPLLAACSGDDPTVVALLVADGSGGASRAVDADVFEDRVAGACRGCRVEVYDAGGDAEEQKSQVRVALAESADVVVVEPVDAAAIQDVELGEVPLVSTGTLAPGADRFVGPEGGLPPDSGEPVLEAARALVLGEDESFVWVPVQEMSEQSADVAVGLLADKPVEGGEDHEGVRSWLFETQRIDRSNLATVLVGQGAVTLEDLCEGDTSRRCTRMGLR